MLTILLTLYLILGVLYGAFVCGSTWDSWGGGSTPIWNGIVSGLFWPFVIAWALLS